jgi:hypothetical protein
MAQRTGHTDVLASLASAFPELYAEDDTALQQPGEAAQAQTATLSTTASADLGSAMKDAKHQDAYEEKITRITGKVGACTRQDMFQTTCLSWFLCLVSPYEL